MRVSPAIGMSLMILLMGSSGVLGSDFKRQTNSSPTSTSPSFLSEFRFGLSAQDPWGAGGRDGSANLTGEILFAKPFTASDLFTSYFIPRPHVGGSLNFDGQTSFAYAGLSWTIDVTPDVFVEGSLGGAVHNGKDHRSWPIVSSSAARRCFANRARWACGCRPIGACWRLSSICPMPEPARTRIEA